MVSSLELHLFQRVYGKTKTCKNSSKRKLYPPETRIAWLDTSGAVFLFVPAVCMGGVLLLAGIW